MLDLAKRNRKLLSAFDTCIIGDSADGQYQHVIAHSLGGVLKLRSLCSQINFVDLSAKEVDGLIEQFSVIWSNMPLFDLAAEILVEHWSKQEVVFVADERYGPVSGKVERRK